MNPCSDDVSSLCGLNFVDSCKFEVDKQPTETAFVRQRKKGDSLIVKLKIAWRRNFSEQVGEKSFRTDAYHSAPEQFFGNAFSISVSPGKSLA